MALEREQIFSGWDELAETPAPGDLFGLTDVSDTGDSAAGSNKRNEFQYLWWATPAVNTVAATGAAETIQWGEVNDLTMDEDCTFDFATVPAAGRAARATVIVRGAFNPSWDGAVDWPDGTEPTYGAPTVYEFVTVDDGTTVLGWSLGKSFA